MAIKELFGKGETARSREITSDDNGLHQRRVFLAPWNERGLAGHFINDKVSCDDMSMKTVDLYCTSRQEIPASRSPDAADYTGGALGSDCLVTCEYRDQPAVRWHEDAETAVSMWKVKPRSSVQSVAVGQGRTFTDGSKVPSRETMSVPVTEIVVTGHEDVTGKETWRLAQPSATSEHFLNKVALQTMNVGEPDVLLFVSEELDTPFTVVMSTGVKTFREFRRKFLLRYVRDADGDVVGGHNHLWNPNANAWQVVSPALYKAVNMNDPDATGYPVFPFEPGS